ncbi:alkanal monooxygenase [Streptomyces atratus]|uniref:LLM class flavin-dependent oxidoreductase n=1 Tax=Streptomyces atratus TaxID=1893 RepID=UPI0016702FB1|nr:LLM class flavin-dependent oxidoreductase [Streptomyces atratus]GGT76002.1 alkanal monooxygenase [Streptomyces atratus]
MTTTTPPLRLGVLLGSERAPGHTSADVFARTLALAKAAENLALDDLWVTEHHFLDTSVNPSALTLAAFLLGHTQHLRVGTAVTLLPLHPPVHVAEQAALLDHLSGGRFALGVGRGQPAAEYEVIGRGIEHWQHGLGEALDIVHNAWNGTAQSQTNLHAFREVPVVPEPRPGTRPPIHVAASSPATIETAATRGLPLLLFYDKNAEAKADMVALHAKLAAAAGHRADGYEHAFALYAHVTDTPEQAHALMRARAQRLLEGDHQLQLLTSNDPPSTDPAVDDALIDAVTERLLVTQPVGDAATCAQRLADHITISGCTTVLCHVETDPSTALHNLRRLATDVFPAVRAQLSTTAGAPQ